MSSRDRTHLASHRAPRADPRGRASTPRSAASRWIWRAPARPRLRATTARAVSAGAPAAGGARRDRSPAAERAAELRADNRELHFRKDEAVRPRRSSQVRDLDGNVIRTIPPSEALDVMSGRGALGDMAGLDLSGLASGVDTESIVEQLMALEQPEAPRVQHRQNARHAASRPTSRRDRHQARRRSRPPPRRSAPTRPGSRPRPSSPRTREGRASRRPAAPASAATRSRSTASRPRRSAATRSRPSATAGTLTLTTATRRRARQHDGHDRRRRRRDAASRSPTRSTPRRPAPVVAAVVKDDRGEERLVLSSRKTGPESTSRSSRRPAQPRRRRRTDARRHRARRRVLARRRRRGPRLRDERARERDPGPAR